MHQNRPIAPGTAGPATPTYTADGDPGALAVGTFQTAVGQPKTSLNPEHANMITQELINLLVALGHTPDSVTPRDSQLAEAIGPALMDVAYDVDISQGYDVLTKSGWAWDPSIYAAVTTTADCIRQWPITGVRIGARFRKLSVRVYDDNTDAGGTSVFFRIMKIKDGTSTPIGTQLNLPDPGAAAMTTYTQVQAGEPEIELDYKYAVQAFVQPTWTGTAINLDNVEISADLAAPAP